MLRRHDEVEDVAERRIGNSIMSDVKYSSSHLRVSEWMSLEENSTQLILPL